MRAGGILQIEERGVVEEPHHRVARTVGAGQEQRAAQRRVLFHDVGRARDRHLDAWRNAQQHVGGKARHLRFARAVVLDVEVEGEPRSRAQVPLRFLDREQLLQRHAAEIEPYCVRRIARTLPRGLVLWREVVQVVFDRLQRIEQLVRRSVDRDHGR